VAVVNLDDAHGARLAAEVPAATTYLLHTEHADFRALSVEMDQSGSPFVLKTRGGRLRLHSTLGGEFNVYNVLGAFHRTRLGGPGGNLCRGDCVASEVPGRFETVDEGQPFAVLVDYACTSDSLANVVRAARQLTDGRLHVVFGCGGDRDRGKRPLMGEIARRLADRLIVTSDNPRSEDPEAIIAEILHHG
jgi:UDP-N-acetylmuramoyl-L-alanyl-D-glutamate--2,6-diaminopimelate ligase